jgi:hypothetical protein
MAARLVLRIALVALAAVAAMLPVRRAHADEIAPELETLELRQKAQAELRKLTAGLADKDRRRLVGLYLAFDPSASDPIAQVACDDDGDYVVVVSDAMLRLVANVARAQSYDEANAGSRRIEEYASFLARSQLPARRLLPPPPGFYTAATAGATYEDRLRESLAFVVAREIAHLRAGDLVCPSPTPTKEHGDDAWTEAEQKKAREIAARVYPGAATRDEEAIASATDAGRTEQGAVGLLRFFAQLEIERALVTARFTPSYLATHPGSAVRLAAVRAAVQRRGTSN